MSSRDELRDLIDHLDDDAANEALAHIRALVARSSGGADTFDFRAAFAKTMVNAPVPKVVQSKEFRLGDEVYALANDMCAVWAKATVETVAAVLQEYESWRRARETT